MLRRLEPTTSYRSLSQGFWPPNLPLGRHSVIYGHNGSGKSSFASLLLEIASDEGASTEVLWEDEQAQIHKVSAGQGGPSPSLAVFTKEWVQRNLSQFLDGATASPIVTLGERAIEAKEEERSLLLQIEDLRGEAKAALGKSQDCATEAKKLATAAQDSIDEQLREFDFRRFSRNRYSLPVVEGLLRGYQGEFPDENKHAEALKRLGEGAARPVDEISDLPRDLDVPFSALETVLTATPTQVALASLAGDQERQAWVERGVQLHHHLDECLFCAGPITEARRVQLAEHFDESWFQIRGRAESLLATARRAKLDLSGWLDQVPTSGGIVSELRDSYAAQTEAVKRDVAARVLILEDIEAALEVKADDPSSTPYVPDRKLLGVGLSASALQQVVRDHNSQAEDHAVVVEEHFTTVLDHIIGSRSAAFCEAEAQGQTAAEDAKRATDGIGVVARALASVRQRQFSNRKMAETLTKDLARVYGKDHLSVAVTDDGKSYACRRGDAPATHLSDGERTTLALLYFLRTLEDSTVSAEKAERIVVIDDPSSSLDREALFATHQWLRDTLTGFGQFIILTHDFGLLRLFLKSQRSQWDESRKKILRGDSDEVRFPKVSFLEMYASTCAGVRSTKVAALPPMLLKHTTEYAYLFSSVMDGVAGGTGHDRLFLLPNAARRVLEVFTSYKAPHLANFDQRLESLMGDDVSNPYRDVYDFCNRFSHGEGGESVDVLDARVIHGQIRRSMEFLKSADTQHFERMCRATGADANLIS